MDPRFPQWNRRIITGDWFGWQSGVFAASNGGVPMSPFRMSMQGAFHHDRPRFKSNPAERPKI
jgi:hypothetical protein